MTQSLNFQDILEKKDALIATAKRCFNKGLQTNAGGNLSVCLASRNVIVIKPSGVGYNECTRENLQLVQLESGEILPSELPLEASKDLEFHLAIYRRRTDINAIVHCHSPWATGYASAGLEIPCLTVQTVEKIGRMPLIPLNDQLGPQTAEMIGPYFDDPKIRAAVMANHGTIGTGKDLMAAQYMVEIIEETAHIAFVRDAMVAAHGLQAPPGPIYGTLKDQKRAQVRE